MNREEKKQAVAALKELFSEAKGLVLTEYKGLSVAEITELRDTFRKDNVGYKVIKNTLASIAAEGTPAEPVRDHFKGPIGIATSSEDAAQVAKSTIGFAKANEKFKVLGGVIEGSYYEFAALKTIAALPTREVLLSTMAGTFQAPAGKMAQLLSATVTKFAYALTALNEKKAAAGQ